MDITQFEQELLAKIISHSLEMQGLPLQVDPFAQPRKSVSVGVPQVADSRREKDEILENIM